jgi:hypothetical protein
MEKPSRDFKGVWIPREVWLSEQLSLMEKVLFVEIHSLDNERGCYATNRYFAEFFDMSERQLRRYIVSLKEKGLITITMKTETERIIRVSGKYARANPEDVRAMRAMRVDLTRKLSLQK